MSGAWRYRVGKDENETLHFVFVRYDTVEHQPNGAVGLLNKGRTLGDMIGLADALLAACKEPVIDLRTLKSDEEDADEDDDDEDDGGHMARSQGVKPYHGRTLPVMPYTRKSML
jgi:hypothetical protein